MTTTVSPDAPPAPPASSADGVAWDLGDLYAGVGRPAHRPGLAGRARSAPKRSRRRYRGKIDVPGGPAADLLAAALQRAGEPVRADATRPLVYASLCHAAKTDDPQHGALLSRTQQQAASPINQHLIFFDLEWVKVPDEAAKPLLDAPGPGSLPALPRAEARLEAALPHASRKRKSSTRKRSPAASAFVRLFDETRGLHPVSLQARPARPNG